jgi:hypothetical protein
MRIAMDSSELLRLQLSKQIDCARNGIAVGATGPTGPAGESGTPKMFTILIDYSAANAISRIYLPPGLSTNPALINGGTFTADIVPDLVFFGAASATNIFIGSLKFAFPVALSGTGYSTAGFWTNSPTSFFGGTGVAWQNTTDSILNIKGASPARLNGGNTANRPTTGVNSGWLATLTITFL